MYYWVIVHDARISAGAGRVWLSISFNLKIITYHVEPRGLNFFHLLTHNRHRTKDERMKSSDDVLVTYPLYPNF